MKKLAILNLILFLASCSFASFKAYFPKNARVGKQIITHSDTLLETQTISLDTNGYVLLISSDGKIAELDSIGDYFLDNVLTYIDSNYQCSKELTTELITFLEQTQKNIMYNRSGYVSCRDLHDTDISLLSPKEFTWYKNIPLSIYVARRDSGKSLKVIVETLFKEHLHTEKTKKPNRISFSSDSLFDVWDYSNNSVGLPNLVLFDTDPSFHKYIKAEDPPLFAVYLKNDVSLKKSYLNIVESDHSEFAKGLLKTAFFRKNEMETYRLSSLIELHRFTKRHPSLQSILVLESGIKSRHHERIFRMIVNEQN